MLLGFRLNIFTSKIQNFLLSLVVKTPGVLNLDIHLKRIWEKLGWNIYQFMPQKKWPVEKPTHPPNGQWPLLVASWVASRHPLDDIVLFIQIYIYPNILVSRTFTLWKVFCSLLFISICWQISPLCGIFPNIDIF